MSKLNAPTITPEYRKLILKAADVMERLGWNNHIRQDKDDTVCVLGALSIAAGRKPMMDSSHELRQITDALAAALGLAPCMYASSLATWSNTHPLKGRGVVAALRSVATQGVPHVETS